MIASNVVQFEVAPVGHRQDERIDHAFDRHLDRAPFQSVGVNRMGALEDFLEERHGPLGGEHREAAVGDEFTDPAHVVVVKVRHDHFLQWLAGKRRFHLG